MADEIIAGRYRLLSVVGRGAMGVVWRAVDTTLNREVAVKMLRHDYAVDASSTERMQREARLAGRLRNPHTVTVFDLHLDDDQSFVVMEFVPGHALADHLARGARMPLADAGAVIAQIAEGLAAAHATGIVHRDIKPGNILITDDGVAKLADFGIARGVEDTKMTATGQLVGTLAFMAPEVVRGQPATAASDVWSLGATLFQAIEGRAPYDDDSGDRHPPTMMMRIVSEPPSRPRGAGTLATLIERMLDRDPGRRPTAAFVAEEIPRLLALDPAPAAVGGRHARVHPTGRRIRRRSAMAAVFGVAVVGAVVAIVLVAVPGSGRKHAAGAARTTGAPPKTTVHSSTPPPDPRSIPFTKRVATLNFPSDFWSIAGSRTSSTAFVLTEVNALGLLTEINLVTGTRQGTLSMQESSGGPMIVSTDDKLVYVVDSDGIAAISTQTHRQVGHVNVYGGNAGLALSRDGKTLYGLFTEYKTVVIDVISTAQLQKVGYFVVPHALSVTGLEISPDGSVLYTLTDNPDQTEGRLTAISTSTGRVIKQVAFAQPSQMAISADGTRLYVSGDDASYTPFVSVLDASTLTVTERIPVPDPACTSAPAPGDRIVYELCPKGADGGSVIAFTTASFKELNSVQLPFAPTSHVFSPDGTRLAVAGSDLGSASGQVVILSPA